jgi:hypothetical protein
MITKDAYLKGVKALRVYSDKELLDLVLKDAYKRLTGYSLLGDNRIDAMRLRSALAEVYASKGLFGLAR